MEFKSFTYKVNAEITLTGLDLATLEYHARAHYDGTCQKFFERPETATNSRGFTVVIPSEREGNLWKREWQWKDWETRFDHDPDRQVQEEDYRQPLEDPEFTVEVTVSPNTLDLCMKILERLGHPAPERETDPHRRAMAEAAMALSDHIREVFHRCSSEWERLNTSPGEIARRWERGAYSKAETLDRLTRLVSTHDVAQIVEAAPGDLREELVAHLQRFASSTGPFITIPDYQIASMRRAVQEWAARGV